ncbi:Membrane associated serine protease, rhomboid family [Hydrobacter penzbergensis]|uniref:Membrane associated serine protease, rhomboid family n=1 Tax=Hydrobacter penzbergensis TaxID=1235997 RepID=A0A8X8IK44_9BACT|nr:rhomboid family intramembrane serine protease [Hydrobacter penzbergensis]SDX56625.1 Membrane associated serine protease, rhomboid family [Hydrobacter penzbergensis]
MQSMKSNRKILLGQDNNALVLLFAINMLLFAGIISLKIIYYLSGSTNELFYQQVLNWLSLPASFGQLAGRPWTLLIYMFAHHGIWQLVSSMLWLWCFGYILQDLAGNNKLFPLYLYGGFIGGVLFLLSNNLVPVLARDLNNIAPMLGAGAAVMAIAVATTTLAPDYRIFPLINGGIPLWVLTLVYVAIDFATLASSNAGIVIAHLGAGITGFFFIRQLRRGQDWSLWMMRLVSWVDDLFNPEKKHTQKEGKGRLFYKSDRKPYTKTSHVSQQKLDAILDKINQHGYDQLTDEEKAFLEQASKEEL